MSKLSELAKNRLEQEGNGEKYLPIADLIKEFPNGVTVNGCRAFHFKGDTIGTVFNFVEDKTRVFPAMAGDLIKIFEDWVAYFGGDESAVCKALRENPVKMKIMHVPQKRRPQPYTKVIILDDEDSGEDEMDEA